MRPIWAFASADLFFLPGLALLFAGHWLVKRWEYKPVTPARTAGPMLVSLAGGILMLFGVIAFLVELAPPLAVVLAISATVWAVYCARPAARRIRAASQTTFRCTPAEAFGLLADPRREALYRPEVERTEIVTGGRPGVGAVIRQAVRIPPHGNTQGVYMIAEERITEYDAPRTFAAQLVGKRARSRSVFEATAGGTRVTTVYDDLLEIRTALIGGIFFIAAAERQIRQDREEGWERARVLLEHPAA